jgi:N-acyl-D-amino-acid deacylase
MHDIVIRGGTIVDGTGAPPFHADVAVDNGRVDIVGTVTEPGRQTIDATGAIVTPGFIDLHTHYDSQIGWDPMMTPSSWHGVTTALMGNCGMTFAPVRPGGGRVLADMMASVEDLAADSIEAGLPWTWETYGGYLDYLATCRPALNVAGMVGHCTLRYYVMGERAVDESPNDSEIALLTRLTSDALDQGAAGFSTSRFPGHRLADRRFVPGTTASGRELRAIAEVLAGRGLMQAVLNTADIDAEMELMTELGIIARGRVLIATSVPDAARPDANGVMRPSRYRQPTPPMVEEAARRGADITATLMPREGGAICGLYAKMPWRSLAWDRLDAMAHGDRLSAIGDTSFRAELVDEASTARVAAPMDQIFDMGGEVAEYMVGPERSLGALAAAAGVSPAEFFLRAAQQSQGSAMFSAVLFNRDREVLGRMLESPRFLPGLGDAGAHLAHIVDASYTTFFLAHWVRDAGAVALAEGIRRLTAAPAALLGTSGRGTLSVGVAADVNVIDLDALAPLAVEPRYDAPLGATRLVQRARGYRATLVNGVPIIADDAHTGARPGEVLRRFATT